MKKIIVILLISLSFLIIPQISSHAEGEEISDLTDTEWVWNELLPIFYKVYDDFYKEFDIDFYSNNLSMTGIRFYTLTMYQEMEYFGYDYPNGIFIYNTILPEDEEEPIGRNWTDEKYRTIKITGGADATNPELIDILKNSAKQIITPTEEEPFLTSNQIILLVVSLIIYILAIFISVLTNNKLLIAFSGLLWVIPIIVIDNFILRVFSTIVILVSFMILINNKEEYYE